MKYLAAYVLSSMGGNASPTAKDIENILGSVGLDVDMEEANKVVKALSGKTVNDVIAAGKEKMSSVPSGGVVASAATGASSGAAPAAAAASAEPEKKKEEEKEESDDDMGFSLFE